MLDSPVRSVELACWECWTRVLGVCGSRGGGVGLVAHLRGTLTGDHGSGVEGCRRAKWGPVPVRPLSGSREGGRGGVHHHRRISRSPLAPQEASGACVKVADHLPTLVAQDFW